MVSWISAILPTTKIIEGEAEVGESSQGVIWAEVGHVDKLGDELTGESNDGPVSDDGDPGNALHDLEPDPK